MPRPIFYPTRPAHVTIGMLERRDAHSARRAQRTAGVKPPLAHKQPILTDADFSALRKEMAADFAGMCEVMGYGG